jgi:hypothetical protein
MVPAALAIFCLVLLLGQFLKPSRAFAQSESAAVSGRVTDQSGAVVPEVEIEIKNVDTNVSEVTTTNRQGFYSVPSIRPGKYLINVRRQGFRTVTVTGVTLSVQDNLSRNFMLQVGSSSESITVTGDAVNINTTDGTVSTVIDHKFVEAMPLNGRSFQDLITLAPGVVQAGGSAGFNGEFSVNGQRTESNYFTVDGVSANVGTSPGLIVGAGVAGGTPSETALGTTQSLVSVDALQEFRANTSTYSSEYGRTPGGQFALTTRSGTNRWHGTAYDYFRNEALDANNWFNNETEQPKEKERQNDFGGTLGGPIFIPGLYNGRDKTFFFFSYEGLRLWSPQGATLNPVPDATFRSSAPVGLQPILNMFPLADPQYPSTDGFGLRLVKTSNPSSIDSVSARIDHSFGNKLRLFGRYANTPTVTSSFGLAEKDNLESNNRVFTIGATSLITTNQTNEFRFNYTRNFGASYNVPIQTGGGDAFDVGSLPGPNGQPFPTRGYSLAVYFFFPDVDAGVQLSQFQGTQRQYNITDSYSWTVGRHNLKVGVDWRRLSTYFIPGTANEFAEYFSEDSVLNNAADFAEAYSGSPAPIEPVYKNFSAFAQDEWKVNSRLSLSLGLRWDVNPAPTNASGPSPYTINSTNPATLALAPEGTPLWHTEWGAFAPRVGLAYRLHQAPNHLTVIRGGFGKFFDMGNTLGSNGFNGIGFRSSAAFSGVSFPLTSDQMTLPPPNIAPPYSGPVFGFDPHLSLPYTLEWNVAIEQALGSNNTLTLSYVASAARRLLTGFNYYPENLGNPNFSASACGGCLNIFQNTSQANSNYNSLQVQFQRRLSHGLQLLTSYTWAHSIDASSVNGETNVFERASSNFDLRHSFQTALTYDVPGTYSNPVLAGVLKHWGVDARIMAQSALPVDVESAFSNDPVTQVFKIYHPDRVPGVPLYLYGSEYPGGKVINYNAFVALTDPSGNPIEGNAGRNAARGFGMWQANLALRREFPIHEDLRLQFRAEAFNLVNHPVFSGVNGFLGSGPCVPPGPGQSFFCFGAAGGTLNTNLPGVDSLYQVGGPRSLQIALKLVF